MSDSVVAVGAETRHGTTLFARNSNRRGGECQPFLQFPTAHHAPGSRVACSHIEIPQVAETYAVMGHSPWWVWGFEQGVNEHAVAIGCQTVFSNENLEDGPGLIGMDLVRLGLERGRDAREALEVIATLVESHGQGGAAFAPDGGGSHNSFLIADDRSAWVLETSNRRWGARRATLDACSNHYMLNGDWEIASRDLEPYARSRRWWRRPERLDLCAAYRSAEVPPHISSGRHRRALELLALGSGNHDFDSMRSLLRDHGDDTQAFEASDSDHEHERYFTLCAHSEPIQWTTASVIAALPDTRLAPWPVWISFGTPCTGVFLPVYLDGVLPARLARGGPEARVDSAWWTFKELQDAVLSDPERNTPYVRQRWAPFEQRLDNERSEVERAAQAAASARDEERAAQIVSDFMAERTDEAMSIASQLRAELEPPRDGNAPRPRCA
jgi:secernin